MSVKMVYLDIIMVMYVRTMASMGATQGECGEVLVTEDSAGSISRLYLFVLIMDELTKDN